MPRRAAKAPKTHHKKLSPRSLWRGAISFGLVNVPVRLYPAVRPNDIHFHMLHDQDKSRLQRKMVCPVQNKEVPYEHIIKGYEISPGHYVTVEDRELEALAPKASRAIEVLYFADLRDIDPLYFQHPYYLLREPGAEKTFELFVRAMEKTEKVAIVKFVMRAKEYVAAVRVLNEALLLETMYFSDEILTARSLGWEPGKIQVGERELKTAQQLIDSLSERFEPEKLHDEYRDSVIKLVEKKSSGEEVSVSPEKPPEKTEVADILAALEESLAHARKKRQPAHA
jgi:DNA end-binding protein Ku